MNQVDKLQIALNILREIQSEKLELKISETVYVKEAIYYTEELIKSIETQPFDPPHPYDVEVINKILDAFDKQQIG
jgi:hypothetical protein